MKHVCLQNVDMVGTTPLSQWWGWWRNTKLLDTGEPVNGPGRRASFIKGTQTRSVESTVIILTLGSARRTAFFLSTAPLRSGCVCGTRLSSVRLDVQLETTTGQRTPQPVMLSVDSFVSVLCVFVIDKEEFAMLVTGKGGCPQRSLP